MASVESVELAPARQLRQSDLVRWTRRLSEIRRDEPVALFALTHVGIWARFSLGLRRTIGEQSPRLSSKYTRRYLALHLGIPTRRKIFLFHYAFILEHFQKDFLLNMVGGRAPLWQREEDGRRYSIDLTVDRSMHGEGDLILELWADGERVYDLSFSFAPSSALGQEGAVALVVARVQGAHEHIEKIRAATRDFLDVHPSHLLLSAAEGVAKSVKATRIYGVSSDQQLAKYWRPYNFNYDRFWSECFEEQHGEWYSSPVPFARKPLEDVTASHRRRTKKKRQFKDAVSDQIALKLASHLTRA